MVNIYLVSSLVAVIEKLEREFGESLVGKTMTFIPTAGKVEEIKSYIEEAFNVFKSKGMEVTVLDISLSSFEECQTTIEQNDLIYVSGGNTFYLLEELRDKGVDKVLTDEITKGKTYIGESAGAIILSPTIDYIEKMDDKTKAPHLKSSQGLNVVNFSPLPHVGHKYLGEYASDISDNYHGKEELVPFSDDQLIIVNSESYAIK
ncbi:Type 1 glutamine amidotransferase-like domain-containing protein [Vagococcus sp. PNs007]|uniref:Type 1 glutamine amidotransferase-like domain-containing protein n=1 Tax=Vagococcus proximus TaxID=2991417 RepID=A0ABT5X2H2_9ENTE|nr:Type 1 glutamine amidotransferase-like domain-containing protein [Vagococcus proximus]